MWVLSELESSQEASQLVVGDVVVLPTVYRSAENAPVGDLVSDLQVTVTGSVVDGRPMQIAELNTESWAAIPASYAFTEGRQVLTGYLEWDPYWHVEFPLEPQLHGRVVGLGVIVAGAADRLAFVHADGGDTFADLQTAAMGAGRRIHSRCIAVDPLVGA